MPETIVACTSVIIVVSIIALSCSSYYRSKAKRELITALEKYQNLETLYNRKDTDTKKIMDEKELECKRMAEIIKSLMENRLRCSVDVKSDK